MPEPVSLKAAVAMGAATIATVGFALDESSRWLVAQAPAAAHAPEWLPDVGNATALTAVIWLCWYQAARAFPKILEDARAEREAMRREHSDDQKTHHEDMSRLTGAIERLAERIAK